MFEIGTKYWFKINGNKDTINIKGKVLEENQFMVKIERDDGSIEIIMFQNMISANKEKVNGA